MVVIVGILIGTVLYCATALPFAAIVGPEGEAVQAAYMLYGVVCGFFGMVIALIE